MGVPSARVRAINDGPVRADGAYVVLWLIGARRTSASFALDRAIEHCRALGKPLLLFEPLRVAYPWASDRPHAFVVEGMVDNAAEAHAGGVTYLPYIEPAVGAGHGLLARIAQDACVIVTDDVPGFFLRRMVESAAAQVSCLLETVDGNGLLPLRAVPRAFLSAHAFRRFWQRELPAHLSSSPFASSLAERAEELPSLRNARVNDEIALRWPSPAAELLAARDGKELLRGMGALPIDHAVAPSTTLRGGRRAALARLVRFLDEGLLRYVEERRALSDSAQSGLSPYLHFGHVGADEIVRAVLDRAGFDPTRASMRATGAKDGYWGIDAASEAFLDELIGWRELGYSFAHHRADFDRYESLPPWAQATLQAHASDARPAAYTLDELAQSRTHDDLWNAAQRQLVEEGVIHNYLRMLWGKKILEWSAHPRDAIAAMIELNNRYALDGRDPNSYSGIFWCLGRFDRPWPERAVFGTVRCMTSDSTAKKLDVDAYRARYGFPVERKRARALPRKSNAQRSML